MKKLKILFLLKKRSYCGNSYGLMVSCQKVAEALKKYGIECKIVTIIDSNFIDREIHIFKPNFCFLEAIYAPPYKILELVKLHRNVLFNVRIHSRLEFLAQESMALEWLNEYKKIAKKYYNFSISGNNMHFVNQMNQSLGFSMEYTPNCYPLSDKFKVNTKAVGNTLSIGGFGALRILKNSLQMAAGAIYVANKLNKKLKFYINDSSTIEKEGNSILKNLINIFKGTKHELVIENWESHGDFIKTVRKMDLILQISMSESYNLCAADGIANGIPVVGSSEIEFLSSLYQAKTTDFEDIAKKIEFALNYKTYGFHILNEILLRNSNRKAVNQWLYYLDYKS